jgi:replicative DNA helicase
MKLMAEMIGSDESYPSDLEAEINVIGAILAKNDLMAELHFLKADDFYSAAYSAIFEAMQAIYSNGEAITPFSIKPRLDAKIEEMTAGGIIKHLTSAVAGAITNDWKASAKRVALLSKKRQIALTCKDVIQVLSQGESAIDESLSALKSAIERAEFESEQTVFETDRQVVQQIYDDLRNDEKPFSTGLARLDGAMGGGLFPGKSYGFAAKKKMGKTMLASTISGNLAQQKIKHLFICCEMSPAEIHQRVISRRLECYPSAFRSDYGKSQDFQKKIAACYRESQGYTLYRNAPGITFEQLRQYCRIAVEKEKVRGIILDYWQLVGGKENRKSSSEHYDEVAQWLADFGRKNRVWMFVLAQINQEGNTRGGEGIRLAFDQVYHLKAPEDDPSRSGRYLEMMDTRYTSWANIGSDNAPAYHLNEKGLYFEETPAFQ